MATATSTQCSKPASCTLKSRWVDTSAVSEATWNAAFPPMYASFAAPARTPAVVAAALDYAEPDFGDAPTQDEANVTNLVTAMHGEDDARARTMYNAIAQMERRTVAAFFDVCEARAAQCCGFVYSPAAAVQLATDKHVPFTYVEHLLHESGGADAAARCVAAYEIARLETERGGQRRDVLRAALVAAKDAVEEWLEPRTLACSLAPPARLSKQGKGVEDIIEDGGGGGGGSGDNTAATTAESGRTTPLMQQMHGWLSFARGFRENVAANLSQLDNISSSATLTLSSNPAHAVSFSSFGLTDEDVEELRAAGIPALYLIVEKPPPPSWGDIMGLVLLSVLQVAGGALLIASGLGVTLGSKLVSEGLKDAWQCLKTASGSAFSWASYWSKKAMAALTAFLTAAWSSVSSWVQQGGTVAAEEAATATATSTVATVSTSEVLKDVLVCTGKDMLRGEVAAGLTSAIVSQVRSSLADRVNARIEELKCDANLCSSLAKLALHDRLASKKQSLVLPRLLREVDKAVGDERGVLEPLMRQLVSLAATEASAAVPGGMGAVISYGFTALTTAADFQKVLSFLDHAEEAVRRTVEVEQHDLPSWRTVLSRETGHSSLVDALLTQLVDMKVLPSLDAAPWRVTARHPPPPDAVCVVPLAGAATGGEPDDLLLALQDAVLDAAEAANWEHFEKPGTPQHTVMTATRRMLSTTASFYLRDASGQVAPPHDGAEGGAGTKSVRTSALPCVSAEAAAAVATAWSQLRAT